MNAAAAGALRLLPLDLVCLDILRRFFHSCRRGRGGQVVDGTPWIRVTTEDMVGYLERDGLEVGYKAVQRSLKRLGDLGKVRRLQRFLHRYDRRMWFAPTEVEEELNAKRPTTVAAPTSRAAQPRNDRKDTSGPLSKSSPSNPSPSKVLADEPPNSQKDRERTREQAKSAAVACDQQRPARTVAALPHPRRTAGHLGLSGILARCLELGGFSSLEEVPQPEPVSPKALISRDGKRLEVRDGATSPLR